MATPPIFAAAKVGNLYVYNCMNLELKYIKSSDVDKAKWDSLVSSSNDGSIFCYSWYLDAFCEWDIIILNDYDGGLALPYTTKSGFRALYQPNFIQKCVWMGKPLASIDIASLQKLLTSRFKKIQFNTNLKMGTVKVRPNLELALNNSIANLQRGYSKSVRKNLRKINPDLTAKSESTIALVVELYKNQWGKLNTQLSDSDYQRLELVVSQRPENFECVSIYKGKTELAAILMAKANNRLHYILGATSDIGKTENALTFGLNYVIDKYADSAYTLDFEGSSIPSVKSFYESFGAVNEPFYEVDMTSRFVSFLKKIYNKVVKS